MVAVTQLLSEAAVRVTEELECLQVQHDSTGPLFLTQRRYCVSPLTVQGRICMDGNISVCDHIPQRTLAEGKGNTNAKRAQISKQKWLTFIKAEDGFRAKRPQVFFSPVPLFQAHLGLNCIFPFFLK